LRWLQSPCDGSGSGGSCANGRGTCTIYAEPLLVKVRAKIRRDLDCTHQHRKTGAWNGRVGSGTRERNTGARIKNEPNDPVRLGLFTRPALSHSSELGADGGGDRWNPASKESSLYIVPMENSYIQPYGSVVHPVTSTIWLGR